MAVEPQTRRQPCLPSARLQRSAVRHQAASIVNIGTQFSRYRGFATSLPVWRFSKLVSQVNQPLAKRIFNEPASSELRLEVPASA